MVKRVFDLDDELLLNGIGWIERQAGITAGFPDKLVWVDSLDGWFVDESDLAGGEFERIENLVEMPEEKVLKRIDYRIQRNFKFIGNAVGIKPRLF